MLRRYSTKLIWFLLLLTMGITALMAEEEGDLPVMKVEVLSDVQQIIPGENFWLAVHFDLQPPWHAYWKNPGDVGAELLLEWQLPTGFQVSQVQWPVPKRHEVGGLVSFGYDAPFTLLALVSSPSEVLPTTLEIGLEAQWVTCSEDSCLPGSQEVALPLRVGKQSIPSDNKRTNTLFADAKKALPKTLSGAIAQRQESEWIVLTAPAGTFLQQFPVEQVSFFPEEGIDYHTAVKFTPPNNEKKELSLVLHTAEEEGKSISDLRGVLVLSGGGQREAYQIDAPLPRDDLALLTTAARTNEHNTLAIGLPLALLFALLGGFFLNLMPCVLPVISLKVLSFIKMASEGRMVALRHGLAFCAGIMISFWVLASLMLILQAYGTAVGWGFQLQEPLFVAVLAAVMLVLALNLFGVFEIGVFFAAWVGTQGSTSHRTGLLASFSSGILATAVATPCTGPFLGSAIGLAVTLPPIWALAIFTAMGCGMAFPYLLLSAYPKLLYFVPKPGPWMSTFKELMGFMMLATVLWLVWVFGAQTDTTAVSLLLVGLFFLSLGLWIYGKWGAPLCSKTARLVSFCLMLGCGGLGVECFVKASAISSSATSEVAVGWETFDPERLESLRQKRIPVLVDFTAKWCLICQTNHLVLDCEQVCRDLNAKGVVKMKADWTKGDPVIAQWLRDFGRGGVPLYLFFNEKGDVAVLPQVLTPQIVLEALK